MWKCCLFIDSYIHHRLKRKIWQIKRQKWNKSGGSSTELTRAAQCWRMILFVVFIRWELKSCALKWSGSPGCAVFGTGTTQEVFHTTRTQNWKACRTTWQSWSVCLDVALHCRLKAHIHPGESMCTATETCQTTLFWSQWLSLCWDATDVFDVPVTPVLALWRITLPLFNVIQQC